MKKKRGSPSPSQVDDLRFSGASRDSQASGQEMLAALEHRSNELAERIKELNCLYGISNLFETEGASLPWIMQRAVNLIPAAWQYPEHACARVTLENRQFSSDNFEETHWHQAEDITIDGERIGIVEVFYRIKPHIEEGMLFLDEESQLLRSVAQRLGKVFRLKQVEGYLRESEERYRILTEHIDEGVTLIHDQHFAYTNTAFCELFDLSAPEELTGKPLCRPDSGAVDDIRTAFGTVPSPGSENKLAQEFCLRRHGQDRWIQAFHIPIAYKETPALLSTFKDISALKQREIAAQQMAIALKRENLALKDSLRERYRLGPIIGKSPAMQEVYELILRAAASESCVTIFGESGTGKELVARAIHEHSPRKRGRFIPVNCGAIPETIFEREFFGHRKGAFSGAYADAPGFLDMAHEGTLFLDEIAELSLNMQVKLLRAIEGAGYFAVGDTANRHSDARIISASNTPLHEKVWAGHMREDFFYRIQVIQINLPPLRERREDIPLLVEHFTLKRSDRIGKRSLPGHVMDSLTSYDWPGNIRELRNVLERWFTLNQLAFTDRPNRRASEEGSRAAKMRPAVKEFEKDLIVQALNQNSGNQTHAARALGISRRSLFRKLQLYGLTNAPANGRIRPHV